MQRTLARLMMMGCAAICLWSAVRAQSPWALRNRRVGGDDLWGVASGPQGLVAVGTNGAILRSLDGQTWTRCVSPTTDWLTAITYGNGRYLAVGDHGRFVTSTDGVTWLSAVSITTQRLNNVLFAAGKFVAVGENGTIAYSISPDGLLWSLASSGTTAWLRGLAFGQAPDFTPLPIWIATGQSGKLLASPDAITWTAYDSHTATDLEAAMFVGAFVGRPVASLALFRTAFATAGAGGSIQAVNFNLGSSFTGTPPIGSNEVFASTLDSSARIRCLVTGPQFTLANLLAGIPTTTVLVDPVVALDEAGNVFSAYDYNGSGLTAPTPAWVRETLSPVAAMRAGISVAAQNSLYVVGENETIFQRDQVFTGRMGNISTLGFVSGRTTTLIAGFVINGTTPKSLLVRAAGPTLAQFGVGGSLATPTITVFDAKGRTVATNTSWTYKPEPASTTIPADIADAARRVGAFAFPGGSDDSALLLTLPPGLYSAQVSGDGGASGLALVEIYDLDARVSGTARAINLSTRGFVSGSTRVLVAGLSVQGPTSRTFLVRGVGPALGGFGVSDALVDPWLTVTSAKGTGYENFIRGSHGDPAATAAAIGVGAFPIGSDDETYLLTLPPGNYTFQLASHSSASGQALIEIYEIGR